MSLIVPAVRAAASFAPRWLAPSSFAAPFVASLGRVARRREVVRPPDGLPDVLGGGGDLEIRLARTRADIRRAQRLRYQVFYEERGAAPTARARLSRRDVDPFDRLCDHLLVVDRAFRRGPGGRAFPRIVGCYRVLRQEAAERADGFYSAREFDLRGLFAAHPGARCLELGRACVLPAYRDGKTIDLLWRGLLRYLRHHRIDILFGCASIDGADPASAAGSLAYLRHHAAAPREWGLSALPERYLPMERIAREALDARAAFKTLPPLLKAYLRLGARCGDGAVLDRAFGVIDVLIVMKVEDISARHVRFYENRLGDATAGAGV